MAARVGGAGDRWWLQGRAGLGTAVGGSRDCLVCLVLPEAKTVPRPRLSRESGKSRGGGWGGATAAMAAFSCSWEARVVLEALCL